MNRVADYRQEDRCSEHADARRTALLEQPKPYNLRSRYRFIRECGTHPGDVAKVTSKAGTRTSEKELPEHSTQSDKFLFADPPGRGETAPA